MKIVADIWNAICSHLVPRLEECLEDTLTPKLKQLVRILEVVRIEEHVPAEPPHKRGRKPDDRRLIARAFVVKAVYNLPTTQLLIEMLHNQPTLRRLCGFEKRHDIPSAATFSRAFAEFAHQQLADTVHAALVESSVGEKVVMHLSRDATEDCRARETGQEAPKGTQAQEEVRAKKEGRTRSRARTHPHSKAARPDDPRGTRGTAFCVRCGHQDRL